MISREDLISQSVFDYVKDGVRARGYDEGKVEFREAFPYTLHENLKRSIVAIGFSFDDGGTQGELGSGLTFREYTIEHFIFGKDLGWGRNLAAIVKFTLGRDGRIPVRDYSQAGQPVIDYLVVSSVSSERQIIPDPEPYQQNVWVVTAKVTDEYYADTV